MIYILMYLFETYGQADAYPKESAHLTHKLTEAGFEDDDIAQAIEWLSGLRHIAQTKLLSSEGASKGIRIFTEAELRKLSTASRSFLAYLENSDVLTPDQREMIIERAMALPDATLARSKFKIIVLMVLWQQRAKLDSLMVEELLTDVSEGEEEDEEDDEDDDRYEISVSVH